MTRTARYAALLVGAALILGAMGPDAAQAQRGGYASSGTGRAVRGEGRFAAARKGSYGSSQTRFGGIGFGPGYGPGFGGRPLRRGPGRYGFGDGVGFEGSRGLPALSGIATSPVLPPALYGVGGRTSRSRAAAGSPAVAAPLLIVIGARD